MSVEANYVEWIRASPDHEKECWEGEIYWAVFWPCGGEEAPKPMALFVDREQAEAFVKLASFDHDWDVAAVVVDIEARDNFEAPWHPPADES